jgi:hypothetical protein
VDKDNDATEDEGPQPDLPNEIELSDGSRLVRVPRDAEGRPVNQPHVEIGFANLGARPPIRQIPEGRVLDMYTDSRGELALLRIAYPQLRPLRVGGEIHVANQGPYRVLAAKQVRGPKRDDVAEGEVVFELRIEPA